MIKHLLAKYLPSRYYFFVNKGSEHSAGVNATEYKMARMASESLIRMWMERGDIDKLMVAQIFATSNIRQVNSLTDIILTTYRPVLNTDNEIEWREEAPKENVGVKVVIVALWRNGSISIKHNIKRLYSFFVLLIDLFLSWLSLPLYVALTLLWALWLMMVKPTELTKLFVDGGLRGYIDREMGRMYYHARWISIVLFVLFLCRKFIY